MVWQLGVAPGHGGMVLCMQLESDTIMAAKSNVRYLPTRFAPAPVVAPRKSNAGAIWRKRAASYQISAKKAAAKYRQLYQDVSKKGGVWAAAGFVGGVLVSGLLDYFGLDDISLPWGLDIRVILGAIVAVVGSYVAKTPVMTIALIGAGLGLAAPGIAETVDSGMKLLLT